MSEPLGPLACTTDSESDGGDEDDFDEPGGSGAVQVPNRSETIQRMPPCGY